MENSREPDLDSAYGLESPEDNHRLYEEWAATYDEDFARRSGYRSPKLVAAGYLEAGGTWPAIDAGCGTGLIADHLPSDAVVDGLDLSSEMLEQARRKGRYRSLMEADLTKPLPCESGIYAGLLSAGTFTLGHVGPEALDELLRLLRPGALCTISGNRNFLGGAAFTAVFDDLARRAVISPPGIREERIYETDASPPKGHENDIGLLISFRKQ